MATIGPGTNPVSGVDSYVLQKGGATVGTFKKLTVARSAVANIGAVLQGHAVEQACVVTLGAGTGTPALDEWRVETKAHPVAARSAFTLLAQSGSHVGVSWRGTSGIPVSLATTTAGVTVTIHCRTLEATFS